MAPRLVLLVAAVALAGCGSSSRSGGLSGSAAGSAGEAGASADRTGPVEGELRRFPGVDVRETAQGVQVRVRGDTSFMADQEPLFVVDGVAITPGPGGTLVGVHRADIVSIQVLKSAAETSIYGPRGANGVVVVRTRTGSR